MLESNSNHPVITDEHSRRLLKKDTFTIEDIEILESKFSDRIEIIQKRNEDEIRTREYVGYIVLPNNTIVINPKIPGIGFLNMLRYALNLPELGKEHPELTKGENYYDILVRYLFLELEKILMTGLYVGYKNYDDNGTRLRGKILFKENLTVNYNRNDKIFCSFSEISSDITENRIIKFTLFYLSHCYFVDNTIDSQLIRYYQRLDEVSIMPITPEHFKSIEYTPLNLHYRPILTLCELLLRDSALDEQIGEKTSISFLINMNILFQDFVGNILKKRLESYEIELQKLEHPGKTDKTLFVKIDIMITHNHMPLLIGDTKYQETPGKPPESHLAQLSLYSNTTHVKNCVLIYVGNSQTPPPYPIEGDITVYVISFDLAALNENEFESKCDDFMNEIKKILGSLHNQLNKMTARGLEMTTNNHGQRNTSL